MSSAEYIKRWHDLYAGQPPPETDEERIIRQRWTQDDYRAITRKGPPHPWQKEPTMKQPTRTKLDNAIETLKEIEGELVDLDTDERLDLQLRAAVDVKMNNISFAREVLESVK